MVLAEVVAPAAMEPLVAEVREREDISWLKSEEAATWAEDRPAVEPPLAHLWVVRTTGKREESRVSRLNTFES